jgi:hypothetical protein
MLPPQRNENKEEIFARKIVEVLGKEPIVSNEVANRLALARQKALTKMKVAEVKEFNLDENFAKQVVNVLNENMQVSSNVEHKLSVSRTKALSYLRKSKKEVSLIEKIINKLKEKLTVQIMTGITATATVCFALIGVAAMDAENESVHEQNLTVISTHFDNADNINKDVEKVLTTDDEEDNTI